MVFNYVPLDSFIQEFFTNFVTDSCLECLIMLYNMSAWHFPECSKTVQKYILFIFLTNLWPLQKYKYICISLHFKYTKKNLKLN
jgi:hypothetical protein